MARVSFMEERVVVGWKAANFAGVYRGYEISETKTARVNVDLLPLPTPLPKTNVFTQKKMFVLVFCLFFPQKANLETPDLG